MQLIASESANEAPCSWSSLPMGEWTASQIQTRLDAWCPNLFGYHLLKIGALSAELSCQHSSIRHHVSLVPAGGLGDLYGDPLALPLQSASVDACLLAHSLDFSKDPHQLLREAERVLTDDGWLLISGYNPLSLWGAGYYVPFIRRKRPWSAQMFTPTRIIDWLHLLGYEVIHDERFGYLMLGSSQWYQAWFECLANDHCRALASVYVLAARKRRFPLTPIRPRWSAPKSLSTGMAHQGW